jgi:integrase/recombinase XerD
MAGGVVMLSAEVERYLSIRRAFGSELRHTTRHLRAFARVAEIKGDTHVRIATATAWAALAPSPCARHDRMRDVVRLARFLHVEDPAHEVPPNPFPGRVVRSPPYIYAPEEVARMIEAAGGLMRTYPLRRCVYATMLGLIAATGLRISEALDLRLDDVLPDGVLRIRRGKFGKSRLVPLHQTVQEAIGRYLRVRCRVTVEDDYLFFSRTNGRISSGTVHRTFRRVLRLAKIAPERPRRPRIHDLRHTFATRALEQCSARREAVSRHLVALATYMGHTNVADTYWYLTATPGLLADIAAAAETAVFGEGT